MSEEILINVTPLETRVAVVEDGALQDVYIERTANRGIVGNIYSGKVARVLPGMQAAFVDIGLERTGFIHVSDIMPLDDSGREDRARQSDVVADHLHDGVKIIVQVTKDPIGNKGARLTTQLSLSSRHLVLMPQSDHIGVSRRIDEPPERARLLQVLKEALDREEMHQLGGFIIRTAAEGVGLEEMRADLRYLKRLWAAVSRRGKAADRPAILYEDLALYFRAVRDLARPGLDRLRIDNGACFTHLQNFCSDYVPEVSGLLDSYCGERPLFELHGVEEEIQRALRREVELKSGGYLIIDQTEAMTTIDVNTGSFVGRKNLEETIFKTNLEAAAMLARQLRVRNLGGIIIVDFIDMKEAEHRRAVQRVLEKAMSGDPVRNKITAISDLGLVEMTRKRSRESLEQLLCEPCSLCGGRGVLKSTETVCCEIFREIVRDARACENDTLMVLAAQGIVDRLLDEESANVANLEEIIGKSIRFRVEPRYSPEHFDVVLL